MHNPSRFPGNASIHSGAHYGGIRKGRMVRCVRGPDLTTTILQDPELVGNHLTIDEDT